MHVLFVEPSFPRSQKQHVRALHAIGARITGIGEAPPQALQQDVRGWLSGYEQVRSVTDEGALEEAVRRVQSQHWVDRLEATVEAHVLPTAKVRERCEIPGTSERTAFLCRDKAAMKHVLREAGIPTAASEGAADAETVREFAKREGYPLVIKPLDAAGAAGATRVEDDDELERAIAASHVDHGARVIVEEWVEGHEGFYDTLCYEGEVVHDFVSHYYPNVLEAMRTRWISPQIVTSNRVSDSQYDEVRDMGKRVIEALGIETAPTHMEWFFGPKGLKFSEIGCRPPGVGTWDLYSAANEFDLYQEWAKAVCGIRTEMQPSRRYSAGLIALRPDRDGQISGYEGMDEIERRFGEHIVQKHLPSVGTGTQDVSAGYHANAWMTLRHEDFDTLRSMLDQIGENVSVRAH
ncbi:MAG: ATP-grasp domain-containing protein [Planctomycetota bacterium]